MQKNLFLFIIILIYISFAAFSSSAKKSKTKEIRTKDGSIMVFIPGSKFIMGSDDGFENEKPKREVFVKSFYIDKYEVTNAQYKVFLDWVKKNSDKSVKHGEQPKNKDHTPKYWKKFSPKLLKKTGMTKLQKFNEKTFVKSDYPVVGIDWFDAYAYAKWAKKRLPTEAEWEKAARGLDGRIWPWGNKWDFKKCNSGGYEWKGERDGHIYPAPVKSFANGKTVYNCFNMAGNVWEWVNDRYDNITKTKIIKGGGSNSYPSWVRPAVRKSYEPGYKTFNLGFRCVKNIN